MIGPKDRARFAAHASPEAIAAEAERARRHLDRAQRYLLWVETVAAQRAAQVSAGTWPRESAAPQHDRAKVVAGLAAAGVPDPEGTCDALMAEAEYACGFACEPDCPRCRGYQVSP